ncbi:MAG: hypothetical protein Q9M31_00470 [Mariprofundus sp.]|nr:hypothetical protein [Mariprofundus sp.]
MDDFLVNISSFPTVIYTTSLVVVIGYWLLAITGTFDLDSFDVGVDIDVDTDVNSLGGMAGLLTTLGLTGVPITIVISLLLLNAWISCYFLSLFVPTFPQFILFIQITIHIVIAIVSFIVSILCTATMLRPLRGLFRKVHQLPKSVSLLGATCRIRSSRVDDLFGEAECQYEGASLIIKVRTTGNDTFSAGDRVVLIEHDEGNDFFKVISEEAFKKHLI